MKKIVTAVALTAISTSAFALDYKFNLEGRADFNNTTLKTTTATTTTKAKESSFVSSLIRLNMMGNINDSLSYRFRYRFNQEGTNTTRDASSSSVDYLYVDHKNSIFTTRFGKQNWAEAYGRESFISSTDLFLASDAYSAYNTNIGTYRYGVGATFTFMETNKVTLAISNPNKALTDTTGETKNNSLAYGIHYSSNLFDKAFQPTLSYQNAKQDNDTTGTNTQKADYSMMAAGFRTEAVANLVIDADWKQFKKEKNTATAAATDGKTSSIFANVAYNINEFSPFVQYVNDKFKSDMTASTSDYKKNSFAAGVMYKPFADTNFRYHLVYTNINKKWDSAAATTKKEQTNKITFGIKADI